MGVVYLLRTRHLILCPLSHSIDIDQVESEHGLTVDDRYSTLFSCTSPTWPLMMNVLFTLFDLGATHFGNEHPNKNLI